MRGSIIIVSFFVAGCLLAYGNLIPSWVLENKDLSFHALCLLMFCVGISLGKDPKILKSFKTLNSRLYLLPVATILGTLAGCALVSVFLKWTTAECMAVGSGFGYYSLSSIFITEYKGAQLGTIALLSNITREIIALLFAPLFAKYFGKLSPISVGGATTMDTTLPVILKFSGKEYMIVSVFHGFVTDFSVPFLVTLFCSL